MDDSNNVPIEDKFSFIMEVMRYTYPRVNNQQGLFMYSVLDDPMYVVITINPEKDKKFDFDFFKKVFHEEVLSVVKKVEERIRSVDITTMYLSQRKFEGYKEKELHDSFVVHFVDGNKTNPFKFRKPNLQEKESLLCDLLKELWFLNIISGKVYKSLKGKTTRNHISENNILEIERFIQNLKSNNTHDKVYEVEAKYKMFCNSDLPYQDWTDPNMFEYLGEVAISF